MDAPEVRKGDFVYRDALFVDLGSNKRHARASPTELKDLLLPKKGSTPQDQVAHWYEAQLLHYGLARTKDKNTAKVRLTNAITTKSLAVPKEILVMEGNMKKDYASILRKAKTGANKAQESKAATSRAKKTSSKTTIELEIDGVKLKIDREAIEAAKKKTATTKAAPKPKETASKAAPKPKATPQPKGAKISSSTPKPATAPKSSPAKNLSKNASSDGPVARPKQTARRGKPFAGTATSRPTPKPSKTYDHTPQSFYHNDGSSDAEMNDAPPPYDAHEFDQESESESEASKSGPVQVSGTYFFPNPEVHPLEITLQKDHRTHKFWGRFHVSSREGVIRIDDMSGFSSGNAIKFGWRSEDEDDGTLRFGRGCDGFMHFDGEGWMKGRFNGLLHGEDVDFEGNLINEEGLDVEEVKSAWDDFPKKAYGRR